MRTLRLLFAALVVAAACGDDEGVTTVDAEPPESATSVDDAPSTAEEGSPDATEETETPGPAADDGIQWRSEGGPGEVDEGVLEVPVDYDDPDAGTFELFVARHHPTDPDKRIGSLLVNPGGPGFGGSDYAHQASAVFGKDLLERFDIIGWDPRGTGRSKPAVDCVDDYDRYYAVDTTPENDAERQEAVDLAEEFTEQCIANNDGYLDHVGTNNSARDMDRIREALGEEQISYLGFSYGSELGAVWATLFPDTVRAAVLDGAADPTADFVEGEKLQLAGFESSLETFLAQCSDDSSCAFHNDGDAEGAFDELMNELDENPISSESGRPDVNRTVALQATAMAMYSETFWSNLETGLAAAQKGDGTMLLALYDSYYQRQPDGTWGNELEAFQAISCMDTDERPGVEEDDANAEELSDIAPRLSPGTIGSYFCTFFPDPADPRIDVTGEGAGPILVVGTTGDPATPLEGSRRMADQLEEGVLLEVEADEHTGYHVNECSSGTIESYLIELDVPDDGTTC